MEKSKKINFTIFAALLLIGASIFAFSKSTQNDLNIEENRNEKTSTVKKNISNKNAGTGKIIITIMAIKANASKTVGLNRSLSVIFGILETLVYHNKGPARRPGL